MRVMLFDHNYVGHHFMYVNRVLPAVLGLCDDVVLAISPEARASQEFANFIQPFESRLKIDATVHKPRDGESDALRVGELARAIERNKADHVLISTIDGLAQYAGIARMRGQWKVPKGVEIEGCFHHAAFAHEPGLPRAKTLASAFLSRVSGFSRLFYVDPRAVERARRRCPWRASRVELLPDPIEPMAALSKAEARAALGIPPNARYVGAAGVLVRRKGIDRLIEAFFAAGFADDTKLLLVGRLEPEIRQQLGSTLTDAIAAGHVVLIDRFVSDQELVTAMCAMDLVALPYHGHIGLSNIVLRSATLHRPVLVPDYGWMGHMVPSFGLGDVVADPTAQGWAAALRRALDAAPSFKLNPRAERLVKFHSVENFRAVWTRRIAERLGKPSTPALPWSWVVSNQSDAALPR